MKIDNQDLMIEFYERNKHLYPDMTFEQMKECCSTPYLFTKREMECGRLSTIRLKYFGTFMVYPKRAEAILNRMTENFKALKVDSKFFLRRKQ